MRAYMRDVDRSLLRENLKLTPAERLEKLVRLSAFASALRKSGLAARSGENGKNGSAPDERAIRSASSRTGSGGRSIYTRRGSRWNCPWRLLSHSIDIAAFGVSFKCIDLATLIKLKRAVGRPKDLESLAELERLLEEGEPQ